MTKMPLFCDPGPILTWESQRQQDSLAESSGMSHQDMPTLTLVPLKRAAIWSMPVARTPASLEVLVLSYQKAEMGG